MGPITGGTATPRRAATHRTTTHRTAARLVAVALFTALVATGCTRDPGVSVEPTPSTPVVLADVALVRADSCDRLVETATAREQAWQEELDRATTRFEQAGGDLASRTESADSAGSDGAASAPATTAADVAPAAASAPVSGQSRSAEQGTAGTMIAGTNNQEAGVDEGDMAKTDGRRLVVLSDDGTLRVVLLDGDPQVDGAVSVAAPDGDGIYGYDTARAQLLLRGDEAIAVVPGFTSGTGTPVVTIARVDLSDAAAPTVVERTRVAGELVATRLIGTTGRIVIRPTLAEPSIEPSSAPTVTVAPEPVAPEPVPTEPATTTPITTTPITTAPDTTVPDTTTPATTVPSRTSRTATSPNATAPDAGSERSATAGIPAAAARLLPQRLDDDGRSTPLGGCEDVLSAPVPDEAQATPSGSGPVPAIATDSGPFSPAAGVTVLTVGATLADLAPVTVEGGAETVYATTEALYATSTTWGDEASTAVHRFDLTGDGAARYTGSGVVPGTVLDQYSMSDRDDALRIVTTAISPSAPVVPDATRRALGDDVVGVSDEPATRIVPAGRLTVLRPDGQGSLREVGHLDDLGVGEQVKSVRYLGDRAYVVTFRQTDPLFAIDVSDDSAPRLLGELKIPGFSEYLHPLGTDRLLGVGVDADEQTGRATGFKVSLFDVSDPTAPTELDTIAEPYRSSSVGRDPHGFTWDPVRNQAIIPVGSTAWQMTGDCEAADCPVSAAPSTTLACPSDGGCSTSAAAGLSPGSRRWSGADVVAVDGDRLVLRGRIQQDLAGVTPDLLRSVVVDSTIWTVSAVAVGATDAGSLQSGPLARF